MSYIKVSNQIEEASFKKIQEIIGNMMKTCGMKIIIFLKPQQKLQ